MNPEEAMMLVWERSLERDADLPGHDIELAVEPVAMAARRGEISVTSALMLAFQAGARCAAGNPPTPDGAD